MESSESNDHHLKMMITGGTAGTLAKTATAPLSRLTILYQVHAVAKNGPNFKSYSMNQSMINVVKDITRQEGVLSFWRGNLTAAIHRFPYSAVNFAVYDFVRKQIKTENEASPFVRLFSGAVAGSVACTACYPLDLVRTRLSVAGDYRGIIGTLCRVRAEEGFLGLYCGLTAALCVAVPQIAINYSVYGSIKSYIKFKKHPLCYDEKADSISAVGWIISGAMSGVLASMLTFPADVLRRRMQMRGATVDGDVKISLVTEIQKIYKQGGFRGFYRGIVPELLKVVPMASISFFVFETMAGYLGVEHEL